MAITSPSIYRDNRFIYLEYSDHCYTFELSLGWPKDFLKSLPDLGPAPGYLSGGRNIYNGHEPGPIFTKKEKKKILRGKPSQFSEQQRDAAKKAILDIIKRKEKAHG